MKLHPSLDAVPQPVLLLVGEKLLDGQIGSTSDVSEAADITDGIDGSTHGKYLIVRFFVIFWMIWFHSE